MRQKKSLVVNFLFNCVLTASNILFPLITFPYIFRTLGPDKLGRVSFATSVVYYFNMFAQLGIPTYGIRACAKVRDNKIELTKTVQEILLINTIMMGLAYICFFVSLLIVPRFQHDKPLFLIISLTMILNMMGAEWLYKALEEYRYITVRSIAFKFVALAAMFLMVKSKDDYVIYGALTILAASASNILNFVNLRKHIYFKRVAKLRAKRHIKPLFVFFSMSIATTIYTHIDIVMLGFMKSDTEVGLYDSAVKVRTLLLSFVTALGTVLLPRASYYIETGQMEQFKSMVKKAFDFISVLALGVTAYFIVFAKESILFLAGSEFSGATVPMMIIMPTVLLAGMTNISGLQMLVPLGRENIVLYSEIVGAIVDLALNAVLIPKLASIGAAIGTLFAEVAVLIVQFAYMGKMLKNILSEIPWIKVVLSILLSILVVLPLKLIIDKSIFLLLAVSGTAFICCYAICLNIIHEPIVSEIKNRINKVINYRRKS